MTTRDKGITLPIYDYYATAAAGLAVTPTPGDYTVQTAWRYGPGSSIPINVTNIALTVPANYTVQAQNANAAFAAKGGNVNVVPGTGSGGNTSGNLSLIDTAGFGGAWNTSHYVMGTYHFWVDSKLRTRMKNGIPANETDGVPLGSTITASAVYDPPNLIANASTTTTVAVAGAVLGDFVDGVSFSLDQQGILFSGYVSAANVVTVILFNRTAGAIDLASGTLRVSVAAGT